jgi:hypothetical protein
MYNNMIIGYPGRVIVLLIVTYWGDSQISHLLSSRKAPRLVTIASDYKSHGIFGLISL